MNTIFPTSYSTFSSAALAPLISKKYGLAEVGCALIVRGVGDTYKINSPAGMYILRIYRLGMRTLEQIEAEAALLLALKQANVSVSYPVADLSGEIIQALDGAEGTRYAMLFTYAPGKAVGILDEKQLRALGHEMAKFHTISSTIQLNNSRWDYDADTTLSRPLQLVKEYFTGNADDYAWLESSADYVRNKLTQFNGVAFSSGYCHFDFLPKNFHFDSNGCITLFDFDFLGYGWLANDLMTFWQQLILDVLAGRLTREAADTAYHKFISAYREYRALSVEELEAVPYLSLGFWLFYLGFYTTHDQFYPILHNPMLSARMTLMRKVIGLQLSL